MPSESVDEFIEDKGPELIWELFHENSKTSLYERHPYFLQHPSDQTVVAMMRRLRRVKPYEDRTVVELPVELPPSDVSVDDAMLNRQTARSFGVDPITIPQLAKVLFLSYGVTRNNEGTEFPRPFRAVPSGGALYPLEIYVSVRRVSGLEPGIYHYDPEDHSLDCLRIDDSAADDLAGCLVQEELAQQAAASLLVSSVFFRSTFKYGDRGYRFVLLEAGHLAQNAVLACTGLGLAAAPIGGYADRRVDRLLGVDGLNESVVYLILVGSEG